MWLPKFCLVKKTFDKIYALKWPILPIGNVPKNRLFSLQFCSDTLILLNLKLSGPSSLAVFTNMEESLGLALIMHSRIVFHLTLNNIAQFSRKGQIFRTMHYLLS